MTNPFERLTAVVDARHETRKQMTAKLAKTPVTPREEAVIHTAKTSPKGSKDS